MCLLEAADRVVTGPLDGDVAEEGPDPEGTVAVLDGDPGDVEGVYGGHLDVVQALHQIGSHVVEGVSQAAV